MKKHLRQYAVAAVAAVVFCAAVWVLWHALEDLELADIQRRLTQISSWHIMLAFASAIAAYLVLTVYDMTAFAYIGRRVAWPRVAFVSFIAYAISHNLGFGPVTGGSVRYRFYSLWRISVMEIAGVIVFGGSAYILALLAVAGGFLLVNLDELMLAMPGVPPSLGYLLSLAGLALGLIYLGWSLRGRPAVTIQGRRFEPPAIHLSAAQLMVALCEWTFASGALYWVLPVSEDVTYWHFVGVYVIAYVAGIISQVPGGLGVFDAIVLLLLPDLPTEAVVAAVITYRALYYLLPLVIGLVLMFAHEAIVQHGRRGRRKRLEALRLKRRERHRRRHERAHAGGTGEDRGG